MCKVGLKAATTTSVYEVTSKSIVRREVVERMCEDVFSVAPQESFESLSKCGPSTTLTADQQLVVEVPQRKMAGLANNCNDWGLGAGWV